MLSQLLIRLLLLLFHTCSPASALRWTVLFRFYAMFLFSVVKEVCIFEGYALQFGFLSHMSTWVKTTVWVCSSMCMLNLLQPVVRGLQAVEAISLTFNDFNNRQETCIFIPSCKQNLTGANKCIRNQATEKINTNLCNSSSSVYRLLLCT